MVAGLSWRPFLSSVQHAKHPDAITGDVINQNIVGMDYQLARSSNAARAG